MHVYVVPRQANVAASEAAAATDPVAPSLRLNRTVSIYLSRVNPGPPPNPGLARNNTQRYRSIDESG